VSDTRGGDVAWLAAGDGHRIPVRRWPAPAARAVVQVLHGMAEHSGVYADVATALNAAGLAVVAHDHRGHGLAAAPGAPGDVDAERSWSGVRRDLAVVNADVRRHHPGLPVIVLGHSMGSFLAQDLARSHPDGVDLLALEGSSYEAPWLTALAGLLGRFECWRQGENGRSPLVHSLTFGAYGRAFARPRTLFDWLSRDATFVDRYVGDPLCGFRIANAFWRDFVRGLTTLYRPEAMKRTRADVPVYVFSGACDPVGHRGRGPERLARALREAGSRDVTLRLYPGARHDLLHETNRDEVIADLQGWIESRLARRPEPRPGLFPRPGSRAEADAFRLTANQVRAFETDGFVAGIRVLDAEALEAVRAAVERIRAGDSPHAHRLYEVEEDYYRAPERNAFHCLGGWLVEPVLHDLVFHPAATVPAAQLLRAPRLRLWHDQLFYKPPRHPGVVAWHQDFSYWTRTLPMNHVTLNIVLDDTSPENGCLHYVPGSQRWPLLPPVSFGQDMEAFRDFLPAELREGFRPVPVPLRAGEASLHHPLTVHGSYENRTPGPRRAVVLNYMGPDTRSADGRMPLLKGTPVVPRGEIVEGEHFPIVLDLGSLG
jgi:alpha-beta hydrolase superfamily lysophospholipase/ectoine hydroxylase-related dioxygenase (phytanoyl-CoA dioxygenase family)